MAPSSQAKRQKRYEAKLVSCDCIRCNGNKVPLYTRRDHERFPRAGEQEDKPETIINKTPSAFERAALRREAKKQQKLAAAASRGGNTSAQVAALSSAGALEDTQDSNSIALSPPPGPQELPSAHAVKPTTSPPSNPILEGTPHSFDASTAVPSHVIDVPHTPELAANLVHLSLSHSASSRSPSPHSTRLPSRPSSPECNNTGHALSPFNTHPAPLGPSGHQFPTHIPIEKSTGESPSLENADSSPSGRQSPAHIPIEQSSPESPSLEDTDSPPPTAVRRPSTIENPPPPARDVVTAACNAWFWRPIMLLCAWLHLQYHVSHSAIALILAVLQTIFIALGLLKAKTDTPGTLKTTFNRLGLSDDFLVVPMCPACFRVYPADSKPTLACSHCMIPLFKGTTIDLVDRDGSPFLWHTGNSKVRTTKPILQTPMRLPSGMLAEIINRTPTMERDLDKWRSMPPDPLKLRCVQDGAVWRTIEGPDKRPFFDNSPEREHPEELRLGVTLGFDGFAFTRSSFSGKHSTSALSLCIQNLDIHEKYRPENLLLCGLTPGPRELNADQLQFFMKAFIDDLLLLYDEGVLVRTPSFPEGRRVRLILVAVCCDHPALCRMCGFADHMTKNYFCTRCQIPHDALKTPAGMAFDAFPARNPAEHRRLAAEYDKLTSKASRDSFCAANGVRQSELNRLPYWNPIRMTIVDPMHNVLLGVAKNQWHDTWVKNGTLRERTIPKGVPRELDSIHSCLQAFEMPGWVARLPKNVGYPAGGSLTSDEWKCILLVYGPLMIPLVWEEWSAVAAEEHEKKTSKWEEKEAKRIRRVQGGKRNADGNEEDPQPKPTPRMHPDDADNFLSLCASMKILLGRTIIKSELPRARELLGDYLRRFLEMHPDTVKPNLHYLTHIFDQIDDYGPVYGFWTFLFERLNKVLKDYPVNNQAGGVVEVTFFREFWREVRLRNMISLLAREDEGQDIEQNVLVHVSQLLLHTDEENRGTVAALIQEGAQQAEEASTAFSLAPGVRSNLSLPQQRDILSFYSSNYPTLPLVARTHAGMPPPQSIFLSSTAIFHDFAMFQGRRLTPSAFDGHAGNSIVQYDFNGRRFVGEVASILTHIQPAGEGSTLKKHLLAVRWFVEDTTVDRSPWDPYPELEVNFWKYGEYLDPDLEGPPYIVPIEGYVSQACRLTLVTPPTHPDDNDERDECEVPEGPKVWGTCGLTRDVVVF